MASQSKGPSARRRGRGEGTIYQRKDRTWAGQVSIPADQSSTGKRQRRSVSGRTYKEVQRKMRELRNEQAEGTLRTLDEERLTVAEFLRQWFQNKGSIGVRPLTATAYRNAIERHLVPSLGNIRLVQLKPIDIQNYIASKLRAGAAPATVSIHRMVLSRAMRQALLWGLLRINPVLLTDPPRLSRRTFRPFDSLEAQQLLEAVKGDRWEAVYTVALSLGLRKGEILALRWQDVNLDTGELRVEHTLSHIDGKLSLAEPKTASSKRTLTMPRMLVAALRAHKIRQAKELLAAGERRGEQGFVFTTRYGTPIAPHNLNKHFDSILSRAGMRRIRIHDLRHSAATLLLVQGVDIKVVSEILGHTSIKMTTNYLHVNRLLQEQAAEQMDAALGWDDEGSQGLRVVK